MTPLTGYTLPAALKLVHAARTRYADRTIGLEYLGGVWRLRSFTGRWTLDETTTPPYARETTAVYLAAPTFKLISQEP